MSDLFKYVLNNENPKNILNLFKLVITIYFAFLLSNSGQSLEKHQRSIKKKRKNCRWISTLKTACSRITFLR